MNISIVGKNIKRIREEKGISAYKLAKLAHVGNTTISEIESGVRKSIKSDTLDKIAEALNVASDDLLKLENNEEYIVQDLENAVDFILESEEASIDDIELSYEEKQKIKNSLNMAIESIRYQRSFNLGNINEISKFLKPKEK